MSSANDTGLPEYLTTEQVAELTTLSISTLERQRASGDGIPYIKLGKGRTSRVIYARQDVLAFFDMNKRRSTSDKG